MYHEEKDKRLLSIYSPQSELIILWSAKIAYKKKKNDSIVGMSTCFKNIFGDGPIKVAHSLEGGDQKTPKKQKKQKKKQEKTINRKMHTRIEAVHML
jgi:hypothetical protein